METPRSRLILVVYRDSSVTNWEVEPNDIPKVCENSVAGFFVQETTDSVSVAQERYGDGTGRWRQVITIPKEAILKRRWLK